MRGAGVVTMGGSPCLIATSELDRLPERRVGRKLFMSCSPRYGTLFLYMPGSSFRRRDSARVESRSRRRRRACRKLVDRIRCTKHPTAARIRFDRLV